MKITHHYKSIISALAALALFYSAAPRAGILDGGEIQFHGLVTDEAPKWTWQVGSPDQTWAVDTADARMMPVQRTDNWFLIYAARAPCRFWKAICMRWQSAVVPASPLLSPPAVTGSRFP